MLSWTNKFKNVLNELKQSDINGCITGSCLLTEDMSTWIEKPDIDIFTYNVSSMVEAIRYLLDKEYNFGPAENLDLAKQEEWKFKRTREGGIKKYGLSTVKVNKNNITVNVSVKDNQTKALDVIARFDMCLISRAFDIPTKHYLNYNKVWKEEYLNTFCDYDKQTRRKLINNNLVTVPNPHRVTNDWSLYDAKNWLRQWDRVIKYSSRGYDTTEVAKFYSNMLEKVIDQGNIFLNSEIAKEMWKEGCVELKEMKEKIDNWLKER